MTLGPDDETPPMGTRSFFAREPLTLRLAQPVLDRLERLQKTGLFGLSLEDVAERLLCERLREVCK